MKYISLINEFNNIGEELLIDDYRFVITDNFHFKSPKSDIIGKEKFISYQKTTIPSYSVNYLFKFSNIQDDEYYVIFAISFTNPKLSPIIRHQTIGIENGKILYCHTCSPVLPEGLNVSFLDDNS